MNPALMLVGPVAVAEVSVGAAIHVALVHHYRAGALVDLVYLGIILYYFVFNDAAKQFTVAGDFLLVGAWVLGVLWYFFWKQRSKTVGVDVSLTYGELPPE